jgi:radical SAM superfamily enzyme YgiQ (UPF0313 family)
MARRKIALISLNTKTKEIPPLGLLYLGTALKAQGHEVLILHKSIRVLFEIEKDIDDFKPDLVSQSVFTGYENENNIVLSRRLKTKGYKIVWGNAHPTLLPKEVLSEPAIDFVVLGEGEETLTELVDNLEDQDNYGRIKGLGFKKKNGEIIINEKRDFMDISDWVIDWSLINVEDYLVPYFSNRFERTLAITTSRGCPYNCQFCYNLVFNKRRWRGTSADAVIVNLKPIIERYHIQAIRFLDDNFFVNKERAFKIVEGLGVPYMAEARVEYVNEDFVDRLVRTGCQEIMFGFESGVDRILKEIIDKGSGTKEIIRTFELFKDSGVMVSGSFIFGLPTETKAEFKESMRFIIDLLSINGYSAFSAGWFLPYPGTGLFEKAKELGFKPPKMIEEWDKFDRWRDNYDMPWLTWDAAKARKYTRRTIQLLALAYKRNLPFLKKILSFRLKHVFYFLPLDIYLFGFLRDHYMFYRGDNALLNVLKKVLLKLAVRTDVNH